MIAEGSKVAYAGDDPMNDIGSQGKVLSMAGSDSAYVQWATGPQRGQVGSVWLDDLVPFRGPQQVSAAHGRDGVSLADAFDNNLDMPGPPGLQVRAIYDDEGEDGLVSAMNEAGKIAVLAEHTEEALTLLASRIRQDPNMVEVLAHLESDEATSLVTRVAGLLLADQLAEEN